MKSDLGKAGILPDGELVLAEAVAGDELPVLRVPHDGGDLATRVHTLQLVHAARVPHPEHTNTHMVTRCDGNGNFPLMDRIRFHFDQGIQIQEEIGLPPSLTADYLMVLSTVSLSLTTNPLICPQYSCH